MMSEPGPLRLPPPRRQADEALGERLAALALGSVPQSTPLRRRRWATPFAGAILLLASGGVAWGTGAAIRHEIEPQPPHHGGRLGQPVASAVASRDGAPRALDDAAASARPSASEDHRPGGDRRGGPVETHGGHHDGSGSGSTSGGSGSSSGSSGSDGGSRGSGGSSTMSGSGSGSGSNTSGSGSGSGDSGSTSGSSGSGSDGSSQLGSSSGDGSTSHSGETGSGGGSSSPSPTLTSTASTTSTGHGDG